MDGLQEAAGGRGAVRGAERCAAVGTAVSRDRAL